MHVFQGKNADEVWGQALAAVQGPEARHQRSRAGDTRELLHVALTLEQPRQRWVVSRVPALNVAFAIAEVLWLVSGRADLAFLRYWNSKLPSFVGSGDKVHGAYGWRLRGHFGVDQLTRAWEILRRNPDSRQVVLQLWDTRIDLPNADGTPRAADIPCNVMSTVKLRGGRLEWMQIMRSNDVMLGLPYNVVQFTTLQEVLAGWLDVEVGGYHHVIDSLHLYTWQHGALHGIEVARPEVNADSLALPRADSEEAFGVLARQAEKFIGANLTVKEHRRASCWDDGPRAYQNLLKVLGAEGARRRGWVGLADELAEECTNPLLRQLWRRWADRMHSNAAIRGLHGNREA